MNTNKAILPWDSSFIFISENWGIGVREFRISDCGFRIEEIRRVSLSHHQSKIQNPKSAIESLHYATIDRRLSGNQFSVSLVSVYGTVFSKLPGFTTDLIY
jgi:hypothetical protein